MARDQRSLSFDWRRQMRILMRWKLIRRIQNDESLVAAFRQLILDSRELRVESRKRTNKQTNRETHLLLYNADSMSSLLNSAAAAALCLKSWNSSFVAYLLENQSIDWLTYMDWSSYRLNIGQLIETFCALWRTKKLYFTLRSQNPDYFYFNTTTQRSRSRSRSVDHF